MTPEKLGTGKRVPGSPEWHAHLEAMLAEEATHPESYWYLSFAEPDKFNGAVVTRARGMASAIRKTHRLGINPGGEIAAWQIPESAGVPPFPLDKLLSKQELGPGAKNVGELEKEGYVF